MSAKFETERMGRMLLEASIAPLTRQVQRHLTAGTALTDLAALVIGPPLGADPELHRKAAAHGAHVEQDVVAWVGPRSMILSLAAGLQPQAAAALQSQPPPLSGHMPAIVISLIGLWISAVDIGAGAPKGNA